MVNLNNTDDFQWGRKYELLWIAVIILLSGFIAKIPQFLGVPEDVFYQKNVSFIFCPLLMIYFNWKNHQAWTKLIFPTVVVSIAAIYVNLFDLNNDTNSMDLIVVHLPILLWILLGNTYLGYSAAHFKRGIDYLRFTADLAILSFIILLSGFLFMAMTMGLFKIIGIDTTYLLQNYVLIWGLPSIPIMATYIVQNNPQIVNKISPLIAKIFTPMVTLMLCIFLFGIIITGKNPSKDRDFLLVFNALLIGVMTLIIFSLSEMTKKEKQAFQLYTLLILSSLTILINCVALYAIFFRLVEFGFSANRIAVIGADLLIFSHLMLVTRKLFLFHKAEAKVEEVEESVGKFLPVYFVWVALIIFFLPLFFGKLVP